MQISGQSELHRETFSRNKKKKTKLKKLKSKDEENLVSCAYIRLSRVDDMMVKRKYIFY